MSIILTPQQEAIVQQLARTTGRTEQELLSEALDRFLREALETARYHAAIDAVSGMWEDYPIEEELRAGRAASEARLDAYWNTPQ